MVLFVIDTLRADQLGSYGAKQSSTPALDALAMESVLFENAHGVAPWTLPSVVSLLTSTFPCEHRVVADGDRLPDAITPLAESLLAAGYATASFYANPYAGEIAGLDRGFQVSEPKWATTANLVGSWLERTPARPFFLYVHNVEPHGPYSEEELGPKIELQPGERTDVNRKLARLRQQTRVDFDAKRPLGTTDNTQRQQRTMAELQPLREKILILYEKDIARADQRLGGVIGELKRRGLWQQTLFVLVSDHGQEFGEHGGWQHDQSVYEELLRVPLLIHFPNGQHGGTRVSVPVSLVDVVPTLAEVLELPELASGARGQSLLPWIGGGGGTGRAGPGEGPAPRVTAMRVNRKKYYRPFKEVRGDENIVVRDGNWKAIWNVEVDDIELYDLDADPSESRDRAAELPERARRMGRVASQWKSQCARMAKARPEERPIDTESRERLRALGYVE